jgi:hypothetical protein
LPASLDGWGIFAGEEERGAATSSIEPKLIDVLEEGMFMARAEGTATPSFKETG